MSRTAPLACNMIYGLGRHVGASNEWGIQYEGRRFGKVVVLAHGKQNPMMSARCKPPRHVLLTPGELYTR